LLVQQGICDQFVERLVAAASQAKLGNPKLPTTQVGPVTTRPQHKRVLDYLAIGKSEGASIALGGKPADVEGSKSGLFVQPSIFTGVNNRMRIAQEEIFGPVLSVMRWRSEAEAIAIANGTPYGLTAAISTHDLKAAFRVARAVRAGYVWINGTSRHYRGTPFGGYRNSGVGREEGVDELLSYSEEKTIHVILE
jgi:acyl-CoA reductase-like NAD-dependent aldehyde dehydrogenase